MAFTMTDRARLKAKLEGECEATSAFSDAKAAVNAQNTDTYTIQKSVADAMAADTTASLSAFQAQRAGKIAVVKLLPDGALTANDTNFGSVLLRYDNGAGGAATTICTFQTTIAAGTGNWVAGTVLSGTVATPVEVAAGSRIFVAITKAAAGVAIPICSVQFEFEET